MFDCFRLALYVYEYLLHVGAQKAAQTFLNEVINWNYAFLHCMLGSKRNRNSFADKMGEKHYPWRTSRFFTFLVVRFLGFVLCCS